MIDKKIAMAENALAAAIDCLYGLISEQGYEGLRSYTSDPARMLAQLEGAKELIHDYAYDDARSPESTRECRKKPPVAAPASADE